MIGLLVKGSTALFLEERSGSTRAVALVNRLRSGNSRLWATKLDALNLERVARPVPLSRQAIDWAYVFAVLTEGDDRRLELGPFDDELTGVVRALEGEQQDGYLTRTDPAVPLL